MLALGTPGDANRRSEYPALLVKEEHMKFRKKPVVIEATQWFKHGDHPEVSPLYGFIGTGWISTLEGGHEVTPGDWIITGVKGEHYPCKPDIFAMTYEEVTQ